MTQPGITYPPQPGWWERTAKIGTNASAFGWATSDSIGLSPRLGTASGTYTWGSDAISLLPAFDAVGAGYTNPTTAPSWSHTLGAGANAIVAFVLAYGFNVSSPPTVTAAVGSTAMTALYTPTTNYYNTGGYYAYLYAFGLLNPPTGAQTINVTLNTTSQVVANSLSYTGTSHFGTIAQATGTSATASLTVPSATGQMVAQAFGGFTTTFTSYNQTQRYNKPFVNNQNLAFVMGDAPGASTVSFTASTGTAWAGIGVPLTP